MVAPDEPRTCASCGAAAPRRAARFCEACGAELPAAAPAAEPAARSADAAARFDALRAHPDRDRWLSHEPDTGFLTSSVPLTLSLMLLFAVIGAFFTYLFGMFCPPLALVPLAGTGFVLYAMGRGIAHATGTARAPLERLDVLVVDERTEVAGGGDEHRIRTDHFVTVETPDGARREFRVPAEVSGRAAVGDVGIGFVKGAWLAEFARFPV